VSLNVTRRALLGAAAATPFLTPSFLTPSGSAAADPFAQLDSIIQNSMSAYGIPGVAVAVLHQGQEYLKGYGVTNLDYPVPVDADTVFRIGSTTKTFTGTAAMRLVEAGRLDLSAPVRRYLPTFRTRDPAVAARVTLRELLNHTAGWLGDYLQDMGPGDDAAARFAAGIARVPQLTPPGTVFAYNNAAVELAGRVIEVVTGTTYEMAVRSLLVDPLGLDHTRFFTDEIIGFNVAASHTVVNGTTTVVPDYFRVWRSIDAAGALISSARDQLRWMRFHLGDGTVPGSAVRLLTERSLRAMRSNPGPGGTLFVELDGVGVSWMLRPTAEGPRVVQHGGDWLGQHSGLFMVPDKGFAMTLLTNSDNGTALVDALFADDWALRTFAGVSNLPATPRKLTEAQLAPYVGRYTQESIVANGAAVTVSYDLTAQDGELLVSVSGTPAAKLAFYRDDYVLLRGLNDEPAPFRANFVRDHEGRVAWIRLGGRLAGKNPSASQSPRSALDQVRPNPLRWRPAS
jgi:CubicO group peptidase (beta-lactamase class C family)